METPSTRRHLVYEDFEIKLERAEMRANNRYRAQVLRSPGGEASGYFSLPLARDRIEDLIVQMGQPRRQHRPTSRGVPTPEMQAACELGGQLFETVLTDEIRACFRTSLGRVYSKRDTGLRIKLRLEEVPELSDLPWEFLLDGASGRFLSLSVETPLVRYIELPQRIPPLPVELPLEILVMVSSPRDLPALDVARERALLDTALTPLLKHHKVNITYLERATLRELRHTMRRKRFHVFHFIGHGGFDLRTDEGILVLEDENGKGQRVNGQRLATVLQNRRSLRLVILNACEGARNSRQDPYAGVASKLIKHGVPAVIAMQFDITDAAALAFADELYTALADGSPVDAAVADARSAIYTLPSEIEWGTPVLYSRAADGVLFQVGALEMDDEELEDEPETLFEPTPSHDFSIDSRSVPSEALPGPVATAEEPTLRPSTPEGPTGGFPQMLIPTTLEPRELPTSRTARPSDQSSASMLDPFSASIHARPAHEEHSPQQQPTARANGSDRFPVGLVRESLAGGSCEKPTIHPSYGVQSGKAPGFLPWIPPTEPASQDPPTIRRPPASPPLPMTPRPETNPWTPRPRRSTGAAPTIDPDSSPTRQPHATPSTGNQQPPATTPRTRTDSGLDGTALPYVPGETVMTSSSSRITWLLPMLVVGIMIIAAVASVMILA